MKRYIFIVCLLFIIINTSACSKAKPETYTISDKIGTKTIVCYGMVECDDIISVKIPDNTTLRVSQGDMVRKGDVLAEYNHYGSINKISAECDGIICDKESYSSKEKPEDYIKYFNLNSLFINAQIPESQAHYYSERDNVIVSGIGFEKMSYKGVIDKISALAHNDQKGSYLTCKISIEDPDTSILPGFTARIEFSKDIKNSLIIPITSIGYDDEGLFVYKLNNNRYIKIPINGLVLNAESFCVQSGVSVGDKILNDITKADVL